MENTCSLSLGHNTRRGNREKSCESRLGPCWSENTWRDMGYTWGPPEKNGRKYMDKWSIFFPNMELWNPNFVETIFIVVWKGSHNPIFRGLMITMVIITPYQKKWSDMGLNNTEKWPKIHGNWNFTLLMEPHNLEQKNPSHPGCQSYPNLHFWRLHPGWPHLVTMTWRVYHWVGPFCWCVVRCGRVPTFLFLGENFLLWHFFWMLQNSKFESFFLPVPTRKVEIEKIKHIWNPTKHQDKTKQWTQ